MAVVMCERWPLASIFFTLITNLLASAMAQPWCFNNGNYTNSSTYRSNLDTLLSSLSSNVDYNGFYNASMGQNPNTVYASVLCRGDLQLPTCRTCIQNATTDIVRSCPNYKQAVQIGDICTLRYSDEPFSGITETDAAWYWWNKENVSSPGQFMVDLRTLVDKLRDQAANGGSLRKVAAGNRNTVDFQTIFSLVQCTPDLSSEDCRNCLIGATTDIPENCNATTGCWILKPSCNIQYDVSPFYNETRLQELQALATPSLQPQPQPPTSSSLQPQPQPSSSLPQGKKDTRTTIIIVVSISIGVFLIVAPGGNQYGSSIYLLR